MLFFLRISKHLKHFQPYRNNLTSMADVTMRAEIFEFKFAPPRDDHDKARDWRVMHVECDHFGPGPVTIYRVS